MDLITHGEFLTILIAIISGVFFTTSRIDKVTAEMHALSIQQAQRSDRLYEMFIELLKEKK